VNPKPKVAEAKAADAVVRSLGAERALCFVPSSDDISLIITAHHSGQMLSDCFESAAKLQPPPREVIVTIDGADSMVMNAASSHGFRIISNPSTPGVSATRNAGAGGATGDIIVFADSDVLLHKDHITRLAQAFTDHPEAAAVIGSYDDQPAAPGLVSRYRNLLHHYTHQHGSPDAQTFWAGCGAVRRAAFEEVGGFDESYRLPSVEDIELGYRLRQAGHRIRLVPDWQVKHLKKWRLRDLIFTDIGRRAIPWTKLLLREKRLDNDLNIDNSSRLSAALVCLALVLMPLGLFWRPAFFLGALLLALVMTLNWKFYQFLARTNGWSFAIASIPLHWLYFLGATVGFVLGHVGPSKPPSAP
jgi:GT2 family glycosyltransferase